MSQEVWSFRFQAEYKMFALIFQNKPMNKLTFNSLHLLKIRLL